MPFLSFTNPAGLWFLPLAGLPLLIHLFRRRRAALIPFPDIRLLQQVQNTAVRPSRIKEYLLLAVRTMILLLLALSLTRPSVNLDLPGWLSGAEQTSVIIMDNSASMAAVIKDTTMLEKARQSARQALKALGPNARAAVVSAVPGSPVVCWLSSASAAERAVTALPQTELGTDLEGAIFTAAKILENAQASNGRIMLFSDLQKSAFGPKLSPLNKLPGNPVITISPANPGPHLNNLAWQDVQIKPLIKKIIVRARVSGEYSPLIGLTAGNRVLYQTTSHPDKDGTINLSFGLPELDSLYLQVSGDDLPLDDRYYLAPVDRREKNVLLLSDEPGGQPDYIFRAFAAMGPAGYRIKKVDPRRYQYYKDIELVVVSKASIDHISMAAILKSMHNGAGLLVAPPLNPDQNQYRELLKKFSDITLHGLADSLSHSIYRLGRPGSEDDLLKDLNPSDLEGVRVRTYWQASALQAAELTINRTDPVLVFGSDPEYKTAALLTGSQPGFGDLVFKPAFLVVLLQTADRLTGRAARQTATVTADHSPGGQAGKSEKAGWIRTSDGETAAANIPAVESELAPVTAPELQTILKQISWNHAESGSGIFSGQSPAARLFLVLAGLMLILETIIRVAVKI